MGLRSDYTVIRHHARAARRPQRVPLNDEALIGGAGVLHGSDCGTNVWDIQAGDLGRASALFKHRRWVNGLDQANSTALNVRKRGPDFGTGASRFHNPGGGGAGYPSPSPDYGRTKRCALHPGYAPPLHPA